MNIPSIVSELKVISVREFPSREMTSASKFLEFWREGVEKSSWYDPQKEAVVAVLLDTKLQISAFNLVRPTEDDILLVSPSKRKTVFILPVFSFRLSLGRSS